MTLVSFADACRLLHVDAKTLRRWLADAHLPLQNHPHDGRKKEVLSVHLEQLAHLHHRCLAPRTDVAPPTALLALPEAVALLPSQIAALQ